MVEIAALIAVVATVCWVSLCKKNREKTVVQAESESAKKSEKKVNWKYEERWEDYPFPDYDKYHTYCGVMLDENGKTFYYRTRNPELKVGDKVYIPVGRTYEKKTGKIVRMENVCGEDIPYPLEKTKFIIGKV